jgi:NAD(P)H-dependent FMN reductase
MKLLIVNGSTRQARATDRIVKWVENNVKGYDLSDVEFETVDLRELGLPMFDEPVSPMMNDNRVTEGPVKAWLDTLAAVDGYIIVTPEYNHAMGNGLKNAIDFIDYQVMKKPFIVVGHGGVGGARAIEQVKLTLNANIGAVPVPNSVNVFGYVGYQNLISETGEVNDDNVRAQEGPLKGAVETLAWYAEALKAAREQ